MGLNLNLSASLNVFKLITRPYLCLPHYTVPTFADLPIPLDSVLKEQGKKADIRAVVLDKDDCFASPDSNEARSNSIFKERFEDLKRAYPGRRLLIVSNTAGATSWDPQRKLAEAVEKETGIPVLGHSDKKPGCGSEVMEYFRQYPETGVTHPSHVAIVGDRLTTDIMMANMMGAWGFWVKDGVVPLSRKSIHQKVDEEMGGKSWSKEEEDYFWVHIIPFSHVRRGPHLAHPEQSFAQLGRKMQDAFGSLARRSYTGVCLAEEHYYKNVVEGRISKHAPEYVKAYKALAASDPRQPPSIARVRRELNGLGEATHPATKPGAEMDWELGGREETE
ncbi:Phosphatidylglycerophosphatase [Scedosporium apiospermum]|uniref:Phosphatidylglycerophosphatase n=1 Tax=Pseudallescheria apiosperma TaxID=563466 RepID=A0A084FWZ4_PSEDA|nr:Phosphatidylglycerophosphatase [Scedosporium apiospermum]KEZ39606.1 Phosphatidylglycerophosphatase [Scedosporium apiospermum]